MSLNLTKFLFQRNILNSSSQLILKSFNSKLINNGIRFVTIKVTKPCPTPINEDFDQKNKRLKRVQSPHLSIYKPQLTSMLSISHRITGCGMVVYAAIFAWGSLCSPQDFSSYIEMIKDLELSGTTLLIMKMIIALPPVYHFLNAIRNLIFFSGQMLSNKHINLSGYVLMASAIGVTVALAMM